MLVFCFPERIPAKVMAILALLHPKMKKLTILPQSPILTQISLFGFWTCYFHSYLSSKTSTTFLPFLVLDLQLNFSVTHLLYLLCTVDMEIKKAGLSDIAKKCLYLEQLLKVGAFIDIFWLLSIFC